MKNGNLAPTLHSLCLCMLWQGTPGVHGWSVTAFVESIQFICHEDELSDWTRLHIWVACESSNVPIF